MKLCKGGTPTAFHHSFERPAKALHVTTPSPFPIECHTVVADVGMDFETAQKMLDETRSAGKATAIDIDGDDDGERDGGSERDGVGETHAQRIRRRVRCIAQEINDAWSAIVA